MAEEKKIGKITHYFGKIGVAVLELSDELKVGDTIHVVGGDREFNQTIGSIQIEHQSVEKAGSGEAVGLKTDQMVKEGDVVFKVIE